MALYECDLTLKKMRVYRDSAELLFFAQPQEKQLSYGVSSPNITTWRLPFQTLSPSEKSSLRLLSPGLTLLHAEWTSGQLFTEISKKISETDPVKPLSLPPPKRLSEKQKKVLKTQEKWALVSDEIRQMILQSISEESSIHEQHSPNSLKSINRQLQISETLSQLQERWSQSDQHKSTSHKQEQEQTEENLRQDRAEMLCLYFQNQQSENTLYSQNMNKVTSGAWIDSIPPSSFTAKNSDSSQSKVNERQGIWLRILIENVYWTPSLVLSLHGDTGRLNVMATLQAENLSTLLKTVLKVQQNETESEIKLEWINHKYHQSLKAIEYHGEAQESALSLTQLLDLNSVKQTPNTCFKSLILMSRSLRDLEGEVALVQSLKRLKLSDTTPSTDQKLGYFCDFTRFKYPPALTQGQESLLEGQRQIRLCLPKLDPFLDELLDSETNSNWDVVIGGVSQKRSPIKRHGSLLHFELESSHHLNVERMGQGLRFLSKSSQHCRVGVLSIDGDQVIDELEIAPLGSGTLKNLEHSHDTLELVHQQPPTPSPDQAHELWPED